MNSRELLAAAAEWLGWQDEDLSARLRNAFDALRLYDFAQTHPNLPEMADEWEAEQLIQAIGYNPFEQDYSESNVSGCAEVSQTLGQTYQLLDSVAFVSEEGDTDSILERISGHLQSPPHGQRAPTP